MLKKLKQQKLNKGKQWDFENLDKKAKIFVYFWISIS